MLGAQGTVEPYSLCCSTLTRLSKSWKHSTSNNCRMWLLPFMGGPGSRSQELLAWRIGEAIGNGVVAASREMVEALAIIYKGRSDDGPTEEEKKNTARFRRFVRWVLLGFVAVVILVVALFVGGAITIAILAIVIPVIAIALFSWTMRKFLVFAWEQARAEFKRNQAIDEYWFAFNRAHAAASGIAHFCSTYWQYLDWAKVLSLMTREPWGRGESPAGPRSTLSMSLIHVGHDWEGHRVGRMNSSGGWRRRSRW